MPLPYMPSGNDRPHGKADTRPAENHCRGGFYIRPRAFAAAQGCPGGMNPAPTNKFYASHLPVGRVVFHGL